MKCPQCGSQTARRRLRSITFERCPACGGSWYAADKLRVLKDRARAGDYRWIDIDLWKHPDQFRAGKQDRLVCPKNKTPMVTVRYGDSRIRVNVCETCRGVWLRQGDEQRILRYLDREVDSKTVGDYMQDLNDELRDVLLKPERLPDELRDVAKVLHLLELRFVVEHPRIASAIRTIGKGLPGA
jgi:Zn-finger nucleic acid-binding protein